jgi:hypothetical protein
VLLVQSVAKMKGCGLAVARNDNTVLHATHQSTRGVLLCCVRVFCQRRGVRIRRKIQQMVICFFLTLVCLKKLLFGSCVDRHTCCQTCAALRGSKRPHQRLWKQKSSMKRSE